MKIGIDRNNLLTINNPNIPKAKEYSYQVSGYTFSDYDKGMVVLHKKDFKIINLKNLGDGMSVVYFQDKLPANIHLDDNTIQQAFGLFSAFDEKSGKTYFFVPTASEKDIPRGNEILKKLHIPNRLIKTDTYVTIDGIPFTGTDHRINLLWGIFLLYGKWDSKKDELLSIKIHVPLFGQYMKYADVFDVMVAQLQKYGLFMKADKLPNKNGIIYQMSSNDYELLEIFAKWYEPVEKFSKISKRDFTEEMKEKLIEFLETNEEIPSEGKAETIKQIKGGVIKFLVKQ